MLNGLQMPIIDPPGPQDLLGHLVDDDLLSVHRHYPKHRLVDILHQEGTVRLPPLHRLKEDFVLAHASLRVVPDDSPSDERPNS